MSSKNTRGLGVALATAFLLAMAGPIHAAPPGMALIPAGEFQMGDAFNEGASDGRERPVHAVYVDAFYMDQYEVTKELWDTVRPWGLSNSYTDLEAGGGKAANHPVHSVNWYDCVKWANARSQKEGRTPCYYTNSGLTTVYKTGELAPHVKWDANGYRLPTEAEWEKAARGGASGRRFPWSDQDTIQHARANYYSFTSYSYDTSPTRGYHPLWGVSPSPYTSPVGFFAPNGYGLHDMAGNVFEWCNDWHSGTYYSSSPYNNPPGPASGTYRVLRGGDWDGGARVCRVAHRGLTNLSYRDPYNGFRLVAGAAPSASLPPIGQLQLSANSISSISGTQWQLVGDVRINNLLRCTGMVYANSSTQRVSGNGEIWLDNVAGVGNVKLYQGAWEFDGQAGATALLQRVLSTLEIFGLQVRVDRLEIISDGVRLRGTIRMLEELTYAELAITGSDYIQVTRSGGVQFSGVNVTIPPTNTMSLCGLPFQTTGLLLRLTPTELQVRGLVRLPSTMGGTTIDLSTDQNHLAIRKVNGSPRLELVGGMTINGPITLGPGYSLKDMVFWVDTVQKSLTASGRLVVPAGFPIDGSIGIRNGYFDSVSVLASSMNKPVIWGPPPASVPIVFLQDVGGGMRHLAPGPPPVVLHGQMAFTAGPQVGSYALLRLEATAEYDTAGRFTGSGEVLLGGGSDPYEFANALVIIDKTDGVYVEGRMIFGTASTFRLDATGQLRVDRQNNMQGSLVGQIRAPSWLGGRTLANTTLYGQFLNDGDNTNDYLVAAGRVGWIYQWEHAVRFDLHTGTIERNADMSLVREVIIIPPLASAMIAMTESAEPFALPVGLAGAIFEVEWDEGDTDLHLTRPDGTPVTPANVDSFPDVEYFKNPDEPVALYAVTGPEGGEWLLQLTNPGGVGGYRMRSLKKVDAPVIGILEPSADVTGGPVTITWTHADSDFGATIGLYYDTDRGGADGVPIVTGLSAAEPTDTYVWDTQGVPSGAYYVYARIDDGHHVPEVSYSVGRVIVSDPSAPAAPGNLAAVVGDEEDQIVLSWSASPDPVVEYRILINPDAAGEGYPAMQSGGDDTRLVLGGLTPGQQYRLAVASVGQDEAVSLPGPPILVTVPSASNHVPVFTGRLPSQATVGVIYEAQVPAFDLDDDAISYGLVDEPAGMTVSTAGVIEWLPQEGQVGIHAFVVTLDDLQGGTNERAFTVHVSAAGTIGRAPEILSQAVPEADVGGVYMYEIVAADPDPGDMLTYELLEGPAGAAVDPNGLLASFVPAVSGWYDFAVKVSDASGRFDIQRFSMLVDVDAPLLKPGDWAESVEASANAVILRARPAPDLTGPVQIQYEQDGAEQVWQDSAVLNASGLLPNTAYSFRGRLRDRAAGSHTSVWSDPLLVRTLARPPAAPNLMAAELDTLEIEVSPGDNPPETELALFNASAQEWIDLSGMASEQAVWADSSSWGTVQISGLMLDTTYALLTMARNADGIETEFGEPLTAKTLAPVSEAQVDVERDWLYAGPEGLELPTITLSAEYINDPYSNTGYSYVWELHEDSTTGHSLVLVGGGDTTDAFATFAGPPPSVDHPRLYYVSCTIIGDEFGNSVARTLAIEVRPLLGPDFDYDGDVDADDFAIFEVCMTGASVPYDPENLPPGCTLVPDADGIIAADFDRDGDVDQSDFGVFQRCYSGSDNPADPDCSN